MTTWNDSWNTHESTLLTDALQRTQLTKRGTTWRGRCPFSFHPAHHSEEATFYYYENTDSFACYACRPNQVSKTGKNQYAGDHDLFIKAIGGDCGVLLEIAPRIDNFTTSQRLLGLMILTDTSKDPRVIAALTKLVGLIF